jgi:Tol biopolymer transport system component
LDDPDISWIGAKDWTPDGKRIAVHLKRQDRTEQIGLLSADDGTLKILKTGVSGDLFVSPDGKFVAFAAQGDIFMIPVEGGTETPVVVHPANETLMGWSADGKYILFLSDRFSNYGLFALSVDAKGPQGRYPQLLLSDIGPASFSMGLTRNGSLYYWSDGVSRNLTEIEMASFDFESERFVSEPVSIPSQGGIYSRPIWSPDGRYMAFASRTPEVQMNSRLIIRELATGRTRELNPGLFSLARWAPDGRSFLTQAANLIKRVDAETGAATVVAEDANNPEWCPDGACIYFAKNVEGSRAFMVRDLSSGAERELIRRTRLGYPHLSPDGRYVATFSGDPSSKMTALLLIPTAGGESRELLRIPMTDNAPFGCCGVLMWSPDGRSIFTNRLNATNRRFEIWRTSIDGQTHQVQIDMNKYGIRDKVSVHPDGRRLLYTVVTSSGSSADQIRVIDNVVAAIRQ